MRQLPLDRALTYFQNVHEASESSKGWWAFDCPFCSGKKAKKAMAVNFGNRVVKCWNAKCPFGQGFIDTFIERFEGLPGFTSVYGFLFGFQPTHLARAPKTIVKKSDIKLPPGFNLLNSGEGLIATRARNYLESRGFDLEDLHSRGFGYCNEETEDPAENFFGYIIIPFYRKGSLVYFIGRTIFDNPLKYKNPKGFDKGAFLYNEDALSRHKTIFVCEGWADAHTIGDNAVATLGWSMSDTQKLKLQNSACNKLVIVADKGAIASATKIAAEFIGIKQVAVVSFEQAMGKDVNEVGHDAFFEMYKETPDLDMKTLLNNTLK